MLQLRHLCPLTFDLVQYAVSGLLCVSHREIGPRSRVWSEKDLVDQAAYEFAEVRGKADARPSCVCWFAVCSRLV